MSLHHLTQLRSRQEMQQATAPHAGEQQMTDDQRARTAQAIVDAGRRRRGELPYEPAAALDPTAAAILAAGRKRRNEEE